MSASLALTLGARALKSISKAVTPDDVLRASVDAARELAATRYAVHGRPIKREDGQPIRALLAGYSGTRNTGADVRVYEMTRQLKHVIGEANVELSVMTQDFARTAGVFPGTRQVLLPQIFPPFLLETVPKYDAVLAVEGSMFKSSFADALTTMMAGSLGIASATGGLAIGYGGEAGMMTPGMASFVVRNVRDAYVYCRNEASEDVLKALGIPAMPGADTAWSFTPDEINDPLPNDSEIVIGAPVDPFCWPVKPDIRRYASRMLHPNPPDDPDHFRSIYYHERSPERTEAFRAYVRAMADGLRAAADARGARPVLVAMEALDTNAAEEIAALVGDDAVVLSSNDYSTHELVTLLRRARLLIASRFHAIVCSMPAGTPAIGVTMDERITNLLRQAGHDHLLFTVDQDGLGEGLKGAAASILGREEAHRQEVRAQCVPHMRGMGEMGLALNELFAQRFPDLNIQRPAPIADAPDWTAGLPPITGAPLDIIREFVGSNRLDEAMP